MTIYLTSAHLSSAECHRPPPGTGASRTSDGTPPFAQMALVPHKTE